MSIIYNESAKIFKLTANDCCYMLKIAPLGYLAHVYYGKNLPDEDLTYLLRYDESPYTPETNDRDRASSWTLCLWSTPLSVSAITENTLLK